MSSPSTYYYAPGSGLVSSRSDWTRDAVQLIFQCGSTLESHQDRAIGEFLIFRGDWLAAMAKLRTASGLSQDPIAHNVVTFGTLSQSWTQDAAKLIIQENVEGTYTYLVGDLTGAYAPGGVPTVGHYTRTIFFLKPNFVLIRDEFNLINLGNTPIFHLHTLDQPSVGITGFGVSSKAAGTRLSGTAAVMCQAAIPIKATVDQVPTWRMDFPADATGGFCVALEAAPTSAGSSQVTMFTPPGLRGAVLGNDMAAVVTGDLPVTYKSPVTGTHYLLGLKPGVSYSALPGGLVKASAAGVLSFLGSTVGTPITVSEGNVIPIPIPIPNPPPVGRRFELLIAPDGTPAIGKEITG